MNKKILTTFIIIFLAFVVFNLNTVFGVGIVSQAWKNGESLIFRTYTNPSTTTVEKYYNTNSSDWVENGTWTYTYNGQNYTSKWIDTSGNGLELPGTGTFSTLGFAFHTKPIGSYVAAASEGSRLGKNIGYNSSSINIGQWVDNIKTAFNNSSVVYTTPSIANTYSDVVFYELMRGIGTYSNVGWGTGLKIANIVNNKKTELRYCIVNINGYNVYVADNIIYAEDLANLINKASNANAGLRFYVSDILISKERSGNDYEVSRSAYDFYYKQNNKQKIGWTDKNTGQWVEDWYWSKGVRGRSGNKAMGSVANLYDNELIVPQTSKRTVLVRHINIGLNTGISKSIIDNSSTIASSSLYFTASNPTETKWGSTTSSTYSGYQEYYEKVIDIDRAVTKEANANTSTYKCIGYNIAVSTSLDYAKNDINDKIRAGQYTSGTTATAAAKSVTSDSDYVVIDFYYTEYEKDVYVNHLFVDKNGYVKEMNKQTILPNSTATMNDKTIYRTNTDKYRSEVYEKKLGYNVYTRIADSLKNDKEVTYKGYELFNSKVDASTLIGKQRTDLNTATTATLTSSNVQVNYYYYYETKKIEQEPEKNIEGKIFIDATNTTLTTSCPDDKDHKPITSIPSGTNARVGITGIPRYMVGAITTEYVSPINSEHNMNLSLTFKMGTQTKTIDIDNIKYRVGYYKVTDMAVYKLKNMTIYDADKGHTGTLGASLFDWKNGQLNLTPNKMDLEVKMIGIKGDKEPIANTASAINNINNYVAVSIEDKNGRVSDKGTANSNLSRVYLTAPQLLEVDANSDGKVTNEDKTFADNKLNEYNGQLTQAKNIQNQKQTAYNNAVTKRATLLSDLNTKIAERDRLFGVYDDLDNEKTDRLRAIDDAEKDIKTLKETTLPNLISDLENLEAVELEKKTQKENAEENLRIVTAEKDRLNTVYLNSIDLRNELAAKANCNDTVDEDVYIYLEQEEKDALEQCRLDKEAYAKNLEDQVVENAQAEYENYLNNEFKAAGTAVETASDEYDTAVTNRQNKETEISNANKDITTKEQVLEVMKREYETFIKEKYTPAKEAYEYYRDVVVVNAQAAYDKDVRDKNVENAKSELDAAKSEVTLAEVRYETYRTYRKNLYAKYDSYKALYDEFMSLNESTAATTLGLKLNVYVQNMIVKVNGTTLTTASSNTAQATYDIATLLKNNTIPQVYTERPVISTDVYSNIENTLMEETDFTNSNNIDKEKLNGISVLAGKAEYEARVVIGNKSVSNIEDTIYYSDQSNDEKKVIFKLKDSNITKTYRMNSKATSFEERYKEVSPINIYTPITVSAEFEPETKQIINQTSNKNIEDAVIQINTPFTIKLGNAAKPAGYAINNTNRFSGGYYVKFDFDVHKVKINGKLYNKGSRIAAGTWIGLIPNKGVNTKISAQAYGNLESDELDVISEENSSYTVRAVAYNATDLMLTKSTKYATVENMMSSTSDLKDAINNICSNRSYFAEETYNVIILNRVFDFRVTDVKDVNWKSVFRTNAGSNTNKHNSIVYNSGTTKWNTKSEGTNDIINRTTSEIGRNPLRILPIGPYKNTNSTYVKAPKMGYRFSYDMKVTGSFFERKVVDGKTQLVPKENKKVTIGTKFYYISKDGKTYLPEYNGKGEGIYLFYKTSNGKYVRIDQNGGGYSLSFTPNDGYRYIDDSNTSTLAKTSVVLGDLRKVELTHDMATVSNNGSVITYYGEYKLPNSTIAVKVDKNGNYDINEDQLKNGYIGVVFDIVIHAGTAKVGDKTEDILLSYSKDTKINGQNTSQWDFEGFLGYTDIGEEVSPQNPIKMRLEKGTWSIDNETYNDIKGSVILYDLDQRAATDYE